MAATWCHSCGGSERGVAVNLRLTRDICWQRERLGCRVPVHSRLQYLSMYPVHGMKHVEWRVAFALGVRVRVLGRIYICRRSAQGNPVSSPSLARSHIPNTGTRNIQSSHSFQDCHRQYESIIKTVYYSNT